MADAVLERLTASSIFDMRGVVAVVTGGGTGIGFMISSALVANGATVYMIGLEQAKLDEIAGTFNAECKSNERRGKLVGIQGDISLKDEAKRLAEEISRREPHITVLFNNAGMIDGFCGPPPADSAPNNSPSPSNRPTTAKAFLDRYWAVTPEAFTNTIRTNAVGAYWMSAAFLPLLERWKESPRGKKFAPQIVMTASLNSWTKDPATSGWCYPYIFSKNAVANFTSLLAHELLPLGIRVNGIAPGFFITEMSAPGTMDKTGASHADPTQMPMLAFEIPTRQAPGTGVNLIGGTNRDMGSLALFLVANWFVDGVTVLIDGGSLLRHPSSY